MARRRKKGGEEHENSERWLLTYADMITLLMAFFIMMYAMSTLNVAKFNAVAFSIRSGLGGMLKGGPHMLEHQPGGQNIQGADPFAKEQAVKQTEQKLKDFVISQNLQDQISVKQDSRGLVISILTEGVLYRAGEAELTPGAERLLEAVAARLKKHDEKIQVEGHTCPIPINSERFPSNWELSASRACQVVRFFERQGIAHSRLQAIGYADTRPRVPNDTPDHRAFNRRVDIVLVNYFQVTDAESKSGSEPEKRIFVNVKGNRPYLNKVRDAIDKEVIHE